MTLTKVIKDYKPRKKKKPRLWRELKLGHLYLRIRLNLLAISVYRKGHISVPNTLGKQKFYLAIVAIFRGEDNYIREWLEFHLMMGVDHFFMYDNGLEESSRKILQPYIDKGQVTHIPWPDIPGLRDNNWLGPQSLSIQQLAYGNCTRTFRRNYKWLIQLDLDEFMFPASEKHQTIAEVLKNLDADKILGFNIRSLTFGSSGHVNRPPGPVIENFTWSGGTLDGYVKCIAHAKYLASDYVMGPHWWRFGFWPELKQKILGHPKVWRGKKVKALFRLNHYEIKSQEEYLEKKKINASGYMAGKESLERFQLLDGRSSKVENFEIQRFLPALKEKL